MKNYDPSELISVVEGFIKKLEMKQGHILENLDKENHDKLDQVVLGMIVRAIDLAKQLIERFKVESNMTGQNGLDTIDMFHDLRKRMDRIDRISKK